MIHNAAGREQGHALLMNEQWGDLPAAWSVYFAVADCDASIAQLEGMGGRKNFGPIEIPAGRFAHVSDPDGVCLYFIQLSESLST